MAEIGENMSSVVERAVELFGDSQFRMCQGNPQGYDFEVHHKATHCSYEKWLWEQAYCEARLERAEREGKATMTQFGLVYNHPEHLQRLWHDRTEQMYQDALFNFWFGG